IDSIYIGTESGFILSYPWLGGFESAYDPRLREWYKSAVKNPAGVWTQPYIHVATKELIVTYAKAFYGKDNELRGVLEVDVTLAVLNERIINTRVGKKGYAFLIDDSGKIIVRPGLEVNDTRWDETYKTDCLLDTDNSELKEIILRMINGETGVSRCNFDEAEKFLAYAPIENTTWSMGVVMPREEMLKPMHEIQEKIISQIHESENYINRKRTTVLTTTIITALILSSLISVSAISISRKITRPILKLNEGANIVGGGNLDYKHDIRTGDEIEELSNTFNKMTEDLKIYISDLKQTTAEKERIESDLRIANEIQNSMLPSIFPPFPNRLEFDIYACMEPAKEVGGDFYDFFLVSEEHLCFVIGDVSGKGVPAALFMVIVKTLIKTEASRGIPPQYVLFNVNNILVPENSACMFATVFCGLLNLKTGELQFANAGHNPPIISRSGGATDFLETPAGFVLGTIADVQFGSGTINLEKDDMIFLYTDGVTEAMNEKKELFSEKSLLDIVTRFNKECACELIREVRRQVSYFVKITPQYDDITMLTVKFNEDITPEIEA
ncbi:MAG TPA: HAMP domain-containing protein, partial [Firmicutes bacterium]|nr:HAMP domain-containing protein [Bacillota bacterium]